MSRIGGSASPPNAAVSDPSTWCAELILLVTKGLLLTIEAEARFQSKDSSIAASPRVLHPDHTCTSLL